MEEEEKRFKIGPNQRRIMQLLEKRSKMTEREIATKIYGKPIEIGSFEYVATSKSLRSLMKRGLVERSTQEVQWSLKKRGSTR